MNNFFSDIRTETKKGNYASVLFLVLITIVLFAIPILWRSNNNSTDKIDAVRVEAAKDKAEAVKEAKAEQRLIFSDEIKQCRADNAALKVELATLSGQFNDFRDKYIAGLESNSGKSANIVKKSKKVISEIQKQKSEIKELNEDINSLSKTLSQ